MSAAEFDIGRPSEIRTGFAVLSSAVVGLLFLLVAHPLAERPFGNGQEGDISSLSGRIVKHWDAAGFLESGGMPMSSWHRGSPAVSAAYVNHPPLGFWMFCGVTRLFGRTDTVLRSYSLLMAALGLGCFFFLLCQSAGFYFASAASLFYAHSPTLSEYGGMVCYEQTVLALILLAFALRRSMPRGWLRTALLASVSCAAGLCDWPGYFLFPAMTFHEWVAGKEGREFEVVVAVGAGLTLSAVTTVLLMVSWFGDFERAISMWTHAFGGAQGSELSLWSWTQAASQILSSTWGYLPLVVAGAGLVLVSGKGYVVQRRLAGALLIPGILNPLLFPGRSLDHEFWWNYAAPGFSVLMAVACLALFRAGHRISSVAVAAALLTSLVTTTSDRLDRSLDQTPRAMANELSKLLTSDDLLAVHYQSRALAFYVPCEVVLGLKDPSLYAELFERWQSQEDGTERLIIMPKGVLSADSNPSLKSFLESATLITGGGVTAYVAQRPNAR